MDWNKKEILFNGNRIIYYTAGSGRPILLIHGYLASAEIWNEFGHNLANDFYLIAPDLPGHGKTNAWLPIHTMKSIAEAVVSIIHQENIQKSIIVGHSMGGYISMAIAEISPQIIDSLILINSHPYADNPEKVRKREREIILIKSGRKELLVLLSNNERFSNFNKDLLTREHARLNNMAMATSEQGMIATLEGMKQRPDRSLYLENTPFKTLWILGKKDPRLDYANVYSKAKKIKGINLVSLENCGHVAFIEEKELVQEIVRNFVSK